MLHINHEALVNYDSAIFDNNSSPRRFCYYYDCKVMSHTKKGN